MTFRDRYSYYTRMASGLWTTLRTPPIADPIAFLRRQLDNREVNFLATLRETIFSGESSPYREMFRIAECEFSDLESEVKRHGLDRTLRQLLDAGVTLSHDEFKGQKPVVRNGRELGRGPEVFRNPLVKRGTPGRSGGSRSPGTPFLTSPSRRAHSDCYKALRIREFDLHHKRILQVRPILPAADGINFALSHRRAGCRVDRWYSPTGGSADSTHYLLATHLLVGMTWLHGQGIPRPRLLRPNDFSNDFADVSSWIAAMTAAGQSCLVSASPSLAARIAAAALDHAHDISGTLFLTVSEPLTSGKRKAIEAAGAQAVSSFAISEIGTIGVGCRAMNKDNSTHLFADSVAVVAKWKQAPLADVEVNSLHFTTLLPYANFVLVNAEFDDSAVIERATCDCEFARAGFDYRLRDIASFGKLTGYGITLVGTDIVEILEQILPARFGGLPTDYQLVEDLDEAQTSIQLLVSPRVPAPSLDMVRECFLREVRRYAGGASASRLLKDLAAFTVKRAEPHVTSRGKILPLYLTRPERRESTVHE